MTVNSLIKKSIVTLVPIDETFFHIVSFGSNKKLSYESVLFNYQKYSPFVDSGVSYLQKDDKLLLWFYDKKYRSMFTVPEGYLYGRYFAKRHSETLAIVEDKALFVIKNNTLQYQSSNIEEIDLLSKKYHIQEVIERSRKWHIKNRKKIINQPLIPTALNFIDRKLLIQNIKEKLSALIIPILVMLSLLTATHYAINQYLQTEFDKLSQTKKETKKETKEMFDSVRKNNQSISDIKNYLVHHNQNGLKILGKIAVSVEENSLKLYYFEYNRAFISLRGESTDVESFLESLSKIDMISSYKLTRQVKSKDDKKEIIVEIILKKGEKVE